MIRSRKRTALLNGVKVSFSIRYPLEPLKPLFRENFVVDMTIPHPLQGLTVEGLDDAKCVMDLPIRIAGKWFLPAPAPKAESLEHYWQSTAPK